jgi:hypothetical protein
MTTLCVSLTGSDRCVPSFSHGFEKQIRPIASKADACLHVRVPKTAHNESREIFPSIQSLRSSPWMSFLPKGDPWMSFLHPIRRSRTKVPTYRYSAVGCLLSSQTVGCFFRSDGAPMNNRRTEIVVVAAGSQQSYSTSLPLLPGPYQKTRRSGSPPAITSWPT